MKALVLGILGLGVAGNAGASTASELLKEGNAALAQTAYAKDMKALTGLPTVEEAEEMDPKACKKVLLEHCSRYQAQGFPCVYEPTLGLFNPCPCEHDRVFAEKMTNKESSKKLSDLFRFTDAAYRQADWNITVGFCHVSRLESRLELSHKEIQEAWEKEKQRQSELMDVVKRYSIQLLPPDQPPSTDETSMSLLEDFNSLRDEYIHDMSAWYERLVKCNEVVSQRFEEFFATYQKYAELKQMNDKNADQLKTVVHGLSKYFEGKTKPSEKADAENPKNLTD